MVPGLYGRDLNILLSFFFVKQEEGVYVLYALSLNGLCSDYLKKDLHQPTYSLRRVPVNNGSFVRTASESTGINFGYFRYSGE